MSSIVITKEALEAVKSYTVPTENLGFGQTLAPVMVVCDYKDGKWEEPTLVPYGPLQMLPTAKVLHYGQEIFEGLKAYNTGKEPNLFRPIENFKRFNFSARRMAMPEVPENYFMDGVITLTSYCSNFIPNKSGDSLYLRPFMIATEESLGIRPASSFKFIIIASPSTSIFSVDSVPVLIERNTTRACSGGTGAAKTGGNYAASLLAALETQRLGYGQTIWLDAAEKRYIEELSGMNFFTVIDDVVYTPALTDTILSGITRKSIVKIAQNLGYEVREEKLDIEDLIEKIKNGNCTEAFACGTAAVVSPIKCLGEANGKQYEFKHAVGPVTSKIKEQLLGIQEGKVEDTENWIVKVPFPAANS